MISILIPIYNGIEFIEASVSSVLNQTLDNWEVIIGVNGHSENSAVFQIAQTYAKRDPTRIRVLDMFLVTTGKSAALNEMVKQCNYEWVCILDVDDIWLPTKLQSQQDFMEKYDVIGTKCQYFQESSGIPNIPIGDVSNFNFYSVNPIINSSCLVKKNLCYWVEDKCVQGIEDYEMWLRLWRQKNKFYNVETVQVMHRIHKTSAFNAKGNTNLVPALVAKYKNLI